MLTLKLKPFDNSTILMAGGAGFVGSNLSRFLLDHTSLKKLVIVDNFLSSQPENIPHDSRVDVIVGSIASQEVLAQLPDKLDYVFHLACFHGNQSSIHDPVADHDNNSLTSLMLFEHLQNKSGIKKVVYAAAGCAVALKTYDEPAATHEDAPVSLFHDSPYSISKLVGEMYGNYYFQSSGLPFVKARFQNVYGPCEVLGAGQWRGTHHTVWRNVVPTFIWKALHEEPLSLDNLGNSTRDFIYVGDLVDGLLRCALLGVPGEAYNLGTGVETTIRQVAELVVTESGSNSELLLGPARGWDTSGRRFASTNKSREELGFIASTDIGAGLKATVSWTRENLHVVSAAIAQHQVHMV